MSEEEQIKRIRKIRNKIIKIIILIQLIILIGMIMIMRLHPFGDHEIVYYVKQMSQQEKDTYNAKVKQYIGDTLKGTKAISMLDTIMSMNQENMNQFGKFISVQAENITEYSDKDKESLEEACKKCNSFEDDIGDNTEENVKNSIKQIEKLKSKIDSSKKYKIKAEYTDGIIYKVKIVENDKENSRKKGKTNEQ